MTENIFIKEALGDGGVVLVTNIDFSEDYSKIESFALILLTFVNDKKYELIKYDFSNKERFNIHYNYLTKPRKVFVEKEVTIDDVLRMKQSIMENWRKYVLLFKQNNYI